jgi:redox-sensitive bicupin YhaK (pirin superfamily)
MIVYYHIFIKGRGIVHSEMPVGNDLNLGLQLWVNLVKEYKMIPPEYQELKSADVPTATQNGVSVKVIAGECMDIKVKLFGSLIFNNYFN